MMNTRMKLFGVVLGVLWCGILIYVLSSLNWRPGGDINQRGAGKQQKVFDTIYDNANQMLDKLKYYKSLDNRQGTTAAKDAGLHKNKTNVKFKSSKINDDASDDIVQVIISGNDKTLMGVIAAINSVIKNTKYLVHFYVALPEKLIPYYLEWIKKSELKEIQQTVRPHSEEIPSLRPHYVKMFMLSMFPELHGRIIYLDSDIIVQGDIHELSKVKIKPGHYGAFPQDCSSISKRLMASRPRYSTHIRLDHLMLREKNINPSACTFNTDVFVADLNYWEKYHIFDELQTWLNKTTKNKIYGIDSTADDAEISMLIVLYEKTSSLPQMWHVSQLGAKSSSAYSKEILNKGKLLHWSGHYKPWTGRSAATEYWDKYFIPDPQNKYKPVRKY